VADATEKQNGGRYFVTVTIKVFCPVEGSGAVPQAGVKVTIAGPQGAMTVVTDANGTATKTFPEPTSVSGSDIEFEVPCQDGNAKASVHVR
jgi:hypothetical protein